MRKPISAMFVRPSTIPPAALTRSTVGSSRDGRASGNFPHVVAEPTTSMFSLTVNGTPRNGPAGGLASAILAFDKASSTTRVMAFTEPFTSAMRSRWDCTTSTLETSHEPGPKLQARLRSYATTRLPYTHGGTSCTAMQRMRGLCSRHSGK